MTRHENLRSAVRVDSKEFGRRNTHNDIRSVVDQNRLSHRIRIRREAPLPPGVTDDRHVGTGTIVLLINRPPQDLMYPEAAEKIARHDFAAGNFGRALN